MKEKIKVLILEDLPSDAELAEREVKAVLKNYTAVVTDTEQGFIKALENFKPDLIISDYMLPAFNGMKALQITRKKEQFIPFIILTGSMNENTAVECMKAGADDYVIKEHIKRLGPAILNALDKKKKRQERKQAEEKLLESEERFKIVAESAGEWIWELDNEGIYTYSNQMIEEILGYKPEEIVGKKHFYDFFKDDVKNQLKEEAFSAFKQKLVFKDFENPNVHKDGQIVFLKTSGSPILDKEGNLIGYRGADSDITERKQAEKQLKNSEEKYRSLFENMLDGFALHEIVLDENGAPINYIFLEVNNAFENQTGLKRAEIIGKKVSEVLPGIEKDPADWIGVYGKVALTGEEIRFEQYSEPLKKWYSVLAYSPRKNYFATIFMDITERQQAEEELETQKVFLERLFESSAEAVVILDKDDRILKINPEFTEIFGYTVGEAVGKQINDLIVPEDLKAEGQNATNNVAIGKSIELETIRQHKNGKKIYVSILGNPIIQENKQLAVYGIYRDITKRKKAENELKINEENFRQLTENINQVFWLVDWKNKKLLYVSPSYEKLFGLSLESAFENMTNWHEAIHPDDYERVTRLFAESAKEEKYVEAEYRLKTPDGTLKWISDRSFPLFDESGQLVKFACIAEDITERKQAEVIQKTLYNISNALNTTDNIRELFIKIREYLGNVIDTTNFYVALYDEKTDSISLPFDVDEKDDYETFPAGKTLTAYVIKTGKPLFANKQLQDELNKQGKIDIIGTRSEIWLGVPLKIENNIIGVIVVQSYDDPNAYTEKDMDILTFVSEEIALAINHKQAEEQIQRDLKEKTILLREIHHRVKNNLQVISGLLMLQENEITTKEDAIKGFAASQDRILAMAKAYELLLGSKYKSEVNVGKYIESLTEQLKYNYDIHHKVKINYSMDDFTVSIEVLDRLGLVFNEIITNSIKYAFEGRDSGNINIKLKEKKGSFVVKISDDGIGIPKDIDVENPESLGLSLVGMLTTQLGGTFTLNRKNGTSFTLEIPKKYPGV